MENQGWIRIYRKSLESSVWENPIFWKVWCWCLMKAAHKRHTFPFNQQDFEVLPGQFVSGRDKASAELRISPRQYRTAIKYLKSTNRLTTKSTNKFTVFTILKWDLYQTNNLNDQQNDQQATSKRPANDQQATTYKNDKKVKNDKNKEYILIFDEARKYYPGEKRGLDTEFDYLRKKWKEWKEIIPLILPAIKAEEVRRASLEGANKFVPSWKHFKTWLYNRCWEITSGKTATPQENAAAEQKALKRKRQEHRKEHGQYYRERTTAELEAMLKDKRSLTHWWLIKEILVEKGIVR